MGKGTERLMGGCQTKSRGTLMGRSKMLVKRDLPKFWLMRRILCSQPPLGETLTETNQLICDAWISIKKEHCL